MNTFRLACFARVIDAIDNAEDMAELRDVATGLEFRDPNNDERRSLENEYRFFAKHGMDVQAVEEQVRLEPGQILVDVSLSLRRSKRDARGYRRRPWRNRRAVRGEPTNTSHIAVMKITTIIFDLGGVYFTDGAKRFVQKMKELHGMPETNVLEVISGDLGKQYRTAEITPKVFWQKAKEHWGLDVDTMRLSKLWLDGYEPISGTVKLVDRLARAGYEVLFLSDNAPDRVDYLESRYKFLGKFKGGVFSHVTKARKPHEKMYTAVLDIASNLASQCVYIDDKSHLLEPAKLLGMHTIAFKTPEQAEHDLRLLGLEAF